MRGLWWKTWRETWLPTEVAMGVSTALAALGLLWARNRPWFDQATVRGSAFYNGLGLVIGGFLLLAAADTPRAFGLDRSGAFLVTKPRPRGAFAVPLTCLIAIHVLLGAVAVRVVSMAAPHAYPDALYFLWLLWCSTWAGALGAVVAGEGQKAFWVPFAAVSLAVSWVAVSHESVSGPVLKGVAAVGLDLSAIQLAKSIFLLIVGGLPLAVMVLARPGMQSWFRSVRVAVVVTPFVLWFVVPLDQYARPVVDQLRYAIKHRTRMTPDPERVAHAVERIRRAAAQDASVGEIAAVARDAVLGGEYNWVGCFPRGGSYRDPGFHAHLSLPAERRQVVAEALAHPDPRVGDAVAAAAWWLVPDRALLALRRHGVQAFLVQRANKDGGVYSQWALGEFHQALESSLRMPTASFAEVLTFLAGLRSLAVDDELGSWVLLQYSALYSRLTTAEQHALLVTHIAAWPEWQRGDVPFFADGWHPVADHVPSRSCRWPERETPQEIRYLWQDLRTFAFPPPEWAQERPWNQPDADARWFYLARIAPFTQPPGLVDDLEALVATVPGPAGQRDIYPGHSSMYGYVDAYRSPEFAWLLRLAPERVPRALEARWDGLPAERDSTLRAAVDYAPHLALTWLRESPGVLPEKWAARDRVDALRTLIRQCSHEPQSVIHSGWAGDAQVSTLYSAWPSPTRSQVAQLIADMQSADVEERMAMGEMLEAATAERHGWDVDRWVKWLRAGSDSV